MRLPGLTGFVAIAIAMIFLTRPILAYRSVQDTDRLSFLDAKSVGLAQNVPRFRVRHQIQSAKSPSESEDAAKPKDGSDQHSELEQPKEGNDPVDNSEPDGDDADESDSRATTSSADEVNTANTTTFPLTTTTIKVRLDNGNGNAAKIFLFDSEGTQISFNPNRYPNNGNMLKAAVAKACISQHLPLDRKTTCYCQYGPPPKKKKSLRAASFLAARKVPSIRCFCKRDHTPVAHDLALEDSVGKKSLLGQTKTILERTLRRYFKRDLRARMQNITAQQVEEIEQLRQAKERAQAKSRKAFMDTELEAASSRKKDVPLELEDIIEDDREYQKRLKALQQLGAQHERDLLAGLHKKNQTQIKQLLLARVKSKEGQVRRLEDSIELIRLNQERRAALLAEMERRRKERERFNALALAAWQKVLEGIFNQTSADLAKSFADFLKQLEDQIASLKKRLARLKSLNASDFGRDARLAAMLALLAQLRDRVDKEQALYDKELRSYSAPCASDAHCKPGQKCQHFGCVGVAVGAPCVTSDDCGNMQFCQNQRCEAMQPLAGSPCTTTADCGIGARCSLNKCLFVPTGTRCLEHTQCGKGQLCEGRVCKWMRPPPGAPCFIDPAGFDNCTIGQRCESQNYTCQIVCEGSPCKTKRDCTAGQGCIGLKCRFFNPPTGSPCTRTEQCAVGHRCVNNVCDLRQSGKICAKEEDCAFAQRCARGLCRTIDGKSPCSNHKGCGNGQRCVGTKKSAAGVKPAGKCEGFSSRGRTCSRGADCPIFFTCREGKCARVLEHSHCSTVGDCGNHMLCRNFQCVQDTSFRGLLPPRLHACKGSLDCHNSRECVNGLCVVIPRELGTCKKEHACGNVQSCSTSVCVPRYASGYPQEGGLCKTTEDCANGQVCSKSRCLDKPEGSPCKTTADCGLSQQCLSGHCFADGASCTSDVHCYTFQTCLSGRCASIALDSPCLAHSDCGNEQLCDLKATPKKCKKAAPRLNQPCFRDAHCGVGMQCDETKKICLWVPVGTLCQTDGFILQGTGAIEGAATPPPPCGNGQVCFIQQCVWTVPAEGSPCRTAFDCGTDQSCAGDKGKPSVCSTVPQGTDCDDHADCGNGQRCDLNKPKHRCVRASKVRRKRKRAVSPCKLTSECGAREVCTAGQCVGQYHRGQDVPDGSPCTTQAACGFGQKCKARVCRIIPRDSFCKSSADCGNARQCVHGSCIDTPAGTLCGNRFNEEDEVVQSRLDSKKAVAIIGGECGVHQICQFNRCRNLFGGHIATAVAPGTVCLTHSECSFRQRCVRGACKLLQGEVHCMSNGDCGNGQMCLGMSAGRPGLCTVMPEGKKCNKSSTSFDVKDDYVRPDECGKCDACLLPGQRCNTKKPKGKCAERKGSTWCGAPEAGDATTSGDMCANGQLCLGGTCHNQFGAVVPSHFVRGENSLPPNALLRGHWVPEGTVCSTDFGCGAAQACGDDLHCSSVAEGSRCKLTEDCGNGQRCTAGKYLCQLEREGSSCSSVAECPKTSVCMNNRCVYQFGHLVGMELARRAEEDWTLASEWRARMSLTLKQTLAALEARQKNNSFDMELAQQTKQMKDEYTKLVTATKILKQEVGHRSSKLLTNSDVDGGGSTCALCVAEQDIQKLVDEVERLKGELERCTKHPEAYIPSCKQDLNFQITKLKEEIIRRRALLEEEVRQLHEEEMRLQKQLNECRSRVNGCEQTTEHRLLLQIMKAQDQLYRRKKKKRRDDQLLVLKCLWTSRKTAEAEAIAAKFKVSVAAGCAQIKDQTGTLPDCLCKQYFDEKKVSDEARRRVQQANAAWKAATDSEASAQERAAAERQKQKDVADQVAKELVYKDMKSNGDWKSQLQKLRDKYKDQVGKLTQEASKKMNANSKNPSYADDQIDLTKLDDCVAPIADATVRQNIKSTFTEGPARNGCALLSLAKTQVIRTAYICLCDAASKGS